MADELGQGKKEEPAQAPAMPEAPEIPFGLRVGREGWQVLDDFAKVVVVERKDRDILSIGFMGYNDNKKIVLSSGIDKWEAVCTDMLGLIKAMKAEARKSKN